MSSDIEQILYPTVLSNLRENVPPVKCIIWKGGEEYDSIEFDTVYPFDTIDDIKRMICARYQDDITFLPRFTFVGVPLGDAAYVEEAPLLDTMYVPINYLWYPNGTNDPKMTYRLKHPSRTLIQPDIRFVTSNGSYASPNYELRGRSTVEQVFLKPRDGQFPVFHVFTLSALMKEYAGVKPIGEEDWNKRFAPYFPDVKVEGPYEADEEDEEFLKKIVYFVSNRTASLGVVNRLLEEGAELPRITVTGIQQMLLTWKKPVKDFEGCASLFYQLLSTKQRPYLRLLPAEGSGITKLHVNGILPIPSLEDPRILEVWNKETTPTPGIDFCCIKYIHRPSMGITPPIYGTIHVLNDGTINLLLQPPKQIRKLDPVLDFRNFTTILEDVFQGLPQAYNTFQLRELAIMFSIKVNPKSKKFTKQRIQQRLPYFQTLFKEIKSLPDDNPMISLRFKAVSQYASEDKIFTFITQLTTQKALRGELSDAQMIDDIQNEFQFSRKEAMSALSSWHAKSGIFTLQLPEDGEFIESFNPGIDIHIYAQHPSYYVHAHRIDNDEVYQRICTLLSILFIEEDEYFAYPDTNQLSIVEDEIEQVSMEREEPISSESVPDWAVEDPFAPVSHTAANASVHHELEPSATASSVPDFMLDDPFAEEGNQINKEEVVAEMAPSAVAASTDAVIEIRKKPKVQEAKQEQEEQEEQKLIDPRSWFIKKLQEIDPRLFKYTTDSKQDNGYSRKCAGNDDRQPSILTKDQYERMREIYREDNDLFWIEYPLQVGQEEPIQPKGTEETITVMRYGSGGDAIHYYFCPHYYCLNDEIMIREKDFEATTDRDDNPKPENTCPFCYGGLITDRKRPSIGYTVIKRKDKKDTSTVLSKGAKKHKKGLTDTKSYHAYMEFMSKTTHPENFALPCCFTTHTTLRMDDKRNVFSHLRDFLQEEALGNIVNNENVNEEPSSEQFHYRSGKAIAYDVLFDTIHKAYILESNKNPEPATFAIAPPQFDTYFRQNSSESIITRVAIHLRLRPTANGFIRVGTEYSINESLLGVIAPLLYKNSIYEVKERIYEVMTPRIFINSHFGNLVLEFYNPADDDPSVMPETQQQLMLWASSELGITLNPSTNVYQLLRIYNAHKRFLKFIDDPTQRKDLRHIQPLLSEPGLFTVRGLQLIVLEDNGDDVTVKCPLFGVSIDRHKNNDFAFISRTVKKVGMKEIEYARYELYIHTSNLPAKGGTPETHETIVRWDNSWQTYWPEIVRQRIDEYMTQCQSRYRSLYTAQEGIHSMAMIPLSKAVESSLTRPEGIVKDSYNHIIGVTFRIKGGLASPLVVLPVIDDGVISISSAFSIKSIYLDWEDVAKKSAAVEDIIRYYRQNLEPLFALYPGYRVKYIVRQIVTKKIVAIQLENGIYIPAKEPKNDAAMDILDIPVVEIGQFEWAIDKQLAGIKNYSEQDDWKNVKEDMKIEKSCGTDEEIMRTSSNKEFEELYQQFRYMVSNWLVRTKSVSNIRKGIEDIIFNHKLPEYEKRKRLYLSLSTILLKWFYPDENDWERASTSFLRKDCQIMNADTCTGNCYWKQEEEKCLLHVKAETELTDTLENNKDRRLVSTPELFTKRIIDELVRFPVRRKQLMKKGEISKLSSIIKPIHQGDQYIIPESSFTWTNLLRLDWVTHALEMPQYYEEMSRESDTDDRLSPTGDMPDELIPIFGEDSIFRVIMSRNTNPFIPFTGVLGITLDQIGMSIDAREMTMENMIEYVRFTSKPIGMIREENIQFVRPRTGTFESVIIFVFLSDTVGMLIQENGKSEVQISLLPEMVQEKWREAQMPPIIKKVEAEQQALFLPGNSPVAKIKRKPLVAKIAQVPLVEAPIVEKAAVIKRKPRVSRAVNSSAAASYAIAPVSATTSAIVKRKPRVSSLSIKPE